MHVVLASPTCFCCSSLASSRFSSYDICSCTITICSTRAQPQVIHSVYPTVMYSQNSKCCELLRHHTLTSSTSSISTLSRNMPRRYPAQPNGCHLAHSACAKHIPPVRAPSPAHHTCAAPPQSWLLLPVWSPPTHECCQRPHVHCRHKRHANTSISKALWPPHYLWR